MRSHGSISRAGELVRAALDNHQAFSTNPLGDWDELVGEQLARHSQPRSLKNKVLIIAAHDSIWKHHLDLNIGALLAKINGNRSEPLVEKIMIRVAALAESHELVNPNHQLLKKFKPKASRSTRKKPKAPLRSLTPDEKTFLEKLPDPDLRSMGSRLLRRLPLHDPADE